MKILLVCSSGGHFTGLMRLKRFWFDHERAWVTFRTVQTEAALLGERVHWAHAPTNRNLPNFLRNLRLALQVIASESPDLVLTTGAGVAVPFVIVGRARGAEAIFVESLTRTRTLSLSAQLTRPFCEIYVQWPELQRRHPGTIFAGVNLP